MLCKYFMTFYAITRLNPTIVIKLIFIYEMQNMYWKYTLYDGQNKKTIYKTFSISSEVKYEQRYLRRISEFS